MKVDVWCRVPKGTVDAVLSYCHNTLNDKSLVDMLPYFSEKGVGVISASVTSMGLFTKQVTHIVVSLLGIGEDAQNSH